MTIPTAGQVEPDPRIERSRRVILSAVLDELGAVGYGRVTIEGVAARAGVGKSTVYRHWPGKLALVEDALRTLRGPVAPAPGGTVIERLTDLLQQVARGMADSTFSSCLPALIEASQRDPEVLHIHRKLSQERRALLVDLLNEGVAAGEVPAHLDVNLLAECLVGPILIRRLLFHEVFDPDAVPALIGQLLGPPPA